MKDFACILLLSGIIIGAPAVMAPQKAQAQERRVAAKRRTAKRVATRRTVRRVTRRSVTRHYYGRPRLGLTVRAVPPAARIVRSGARAYYLDQGIYYTARGNGFVVVRPAVGLRIRTLPRGFVHTVVRGTPYFYYYGTFYTPVDDTDEYQVVSPPEGAVVDALPEGYEAVEVSGKPYLKLDDVYYETIETDLFDDGYGYQVVNI